ncbi:hypothetical protein [Streptomyces sp. NPDC001068]|uniref:hypothetical protein n=1 Tax=Streptomyces sp. NPDC001068 TaxID=3364544 RepID=UPI0036B5F33B
MRVHMSGAAAYEAGAHAGAERFGPEGAGSTRGVKALDFHDLTLSDTTRTTRVPTHRHLAHFLGTSDTHILRDRPSDDLTPARRAAQPLMEKAGADRPGALHAAIDLVRRGGTVSLSGGYGGAMAPLPRP